jgi:uncharacterized membrane protein YukC
MANRIKSIKGEVVDFDLLKIKEDISAAPKTDEVDSRERYVNRKLRRRSKQPVTAKMKEDMRKMNERMKEADEEDETGKTDEATENVEKVENTQEEKNTKTDDKDKKSKKRRVIKK